MIQVWATGYQAGYDPLLGEDPIEPQDRVAAKATMAERYRYQRMRLQQRPGAQLGATEQDAPSDEDSDQSEGSSAR